ncbi:MAG: HNH endonuclease signature motif containing protein [Actinomycetia bacterium]|nr:HNH endonuclease signature motif containing protein [Actinomycetes bacterium]
MELKTASSTGSVHGIVDMVRGAIEVTSVPTEEHTAPGWMEVLTEISSAMSVLTAARDVALVKLAAIEEVVTEDGVVGEQVNGIGAVSVDAAAMAATAQGVTPRFAQDQIDHAVTRVARVPALHKAMRAGRLDDYKAKCLGGELTGVPGDLANAVVTALEDEMESKTGPALRRRARAILSALAPELLEERIRAARNTIGLRRRTGEPGTDNWDAVFPSERSATVWAAIDALAREYKADDKYPTLEQARAYAMLDLISGNATVTTTLHITASADALAEAEATAAAAADSPHAGADGSMGEPVDATVGSTATADDPDMPAATTGHSASGETYVGVRASRGNECTWLPLTTLRELLPPTDAISDRPPRIAHPQSGALLDPEGSLSTDAYRPGVRLRRFIRLRDGHCRFPGCGVSARQCDIDHAVPWPTGPTAAANLILLCRRHHRVKQRHRWRVRLLADLRVEWIDPTGRRLVTDPVDHLLVGETRAAHVPPVTAEQVARMREDEALRDYADHLDEERRARESAPPPEPAPAMPWEVADPLARLMAQALDEEIAELTRLLHPTRDPAAAGPNDPAPQSVAEGWLGACVLELMVEQRDDYLEESQVPSRQPFRLDGTPVGALPAGVTPSPQRPLRGWATQEDRDRLAAAGITDTIHTREQAHEALAAHEQACLAAAWEARVQEIKTDRSRIDIEHPRVGIRYRIKRKERRAMRRERRRQARLRAQIRDGGPPF